MAGACDALDRTLHVLQHESQLCEWMNCSAWRTVDCAVDSNAQLPRHLPLVVHQLRRIGERAKWGRARVVVTPLPLNRRWLLPLLRPPAREQQPEDPQSRVLRSFPSTDVVIARCLEPVAEWLPLLLLHLPPNTRVRVFLYEMCRGEALNAYDSAAARDWATPWAYWLDVPIMRTALPNRGFESAAYIQHIIFAMRANDVAEATLFLQAGWREHSPRLLGCDWLERSMASASFMHYGSHYSTGGDNGCWDVCMAYHVWAVTLPGHRILRSATSSYAIFHAYRERIVGRSLSQWQELHSVATLSSAALRDRLCGRRLPICPGRGCQKRLHQEEGFASLRVYCNDSGKMAGLGIELGWHIFLGEPDVLPLDKAPFSEVHSAFAPRPWRPRLGPPCSTTAVYPIRSDTSEFARGNPLGLPWRPWAAELGLGLAPSRLAAVLVRLVHASVLQGLSLGEVCAEEAQRDSLRFALRTESVAAKAAADMSADEAEKEEDWLVRFVTYRAPAHAAPAPPHHVSSQPQAGVASSIVRADLSSQRYTRQPHRQAPQPQTPGMPNARRGTPARRVDGNPVRRCCPWVAVTARQPKSSRCGVQDASSTDAWWRSEAPANATPRVLRIRMNHGSAGFFAYVLFALNQIAFAEKHGLIPYVAFSECTVNGYDHYASGGRNLYFDAALGSNMWEYFFEPVSAYREGAPGYTVLALPSKTLWRIHHRNRGSVFAYYYGAFAGKQGYDEPWFRGMREKAHRLLSRYVRPKAHILRQVEAFWSANFPSSAPVLGVHLRGTDKLVGIGGKVVQPYEYVPHIEKYLRASNYTASIFIATDAPTFVSWLKKRYPTRIVVREALRSEKNAFLDPNVPNPAQKGEDVLIDALLLSRCSFLLKCASAVGEFALYFNPELHHRSIDVQLAAPTTPQAALLMTGGQQSVHASSSAVDNHRVATTSEGAAPSTVCSSLETALAVLARRTDFCSLFAVCNERKLLRCAVGMAALPYGLSRVQTLYGAFREMYGAYAPFLRSGRPTLRQLVLDVSRSTSARAATDVIISRCTEPVLEILARLFAVVPAMKTARVLIHERCINMGRSSSPVDVPSLDVRDTLLNVQRLAVHGAKDATALHLSWLLQKSSPSKTSKLPPAVFVHASALGSLSEDQNIPLFARLLSRSDPANEEVGGRLALHLNPIAHAGSSPRPRPSDPAGGQACLDRKPLHTFGTAKAEAPTAACVFWVGGRTLKQALRRNRPPEILSTRWLTEIAVEVHRDSSSSLLQLLLRAISRSAQEGRQYAHSFKEIVKACHMLVTLDPDYFLYNRELLHAAFTDGSHTGCRDTYNMSSHLAGRRRALSAQLHSSQRLSSSTKCTQRRLQYTRLLSAGWLSTLLGVIKPLSYSVRTGSMLLTPKVLAFTGPGSCPQRDLSCFFERLAPECDGVLEGGPEFDGARPHTALAEFIDLENDSFVANESPASVPSPIPGTFREQGWFWWSSQLLSHVMRPSEELASDLEAALEVTGLGALLKDGVPVIGVHIRRGDACSRRERKRMARTCSPVPAYMEHVQVLASMLRTTHVFLATDSEDAILEAHRYTQYTIHHMPNMSTGATSSAASQRPQLWDDKIASREAAGLTELSQREAWLATLDVLLLARCTAFVGKFTSSLFRAAYALHNARCDCAAPFVSLDSPWCLDYGRKTGGNWNFPNPAPPGHLGRASNRFWC